MRKPTQALQPLDREAIVHVDLPADGLALSPISMVYGWIADARVQSFDRLSLVNRRGDVIALSLVDRPDVRASVPGVESVGFSAWVDLRTVTAGPWNLRYEHEGTASEIPVPLTADSEQLHRFVTFKAQKLAMLRELLRCPTCRTVLHHDNERLRCAAGHVFRIGPDAFDFLDDALRERIGAVPTENVSAHGYDPTLLQLIDECNGLILDVGAGLRPSYRKDIINVEIVAYPTTDVVAASEYLPFADESFDLVISVAVLEHVRDPFAAAQELQRVLKPGGRIFAAVPFLQPYHAYPDHYYNMTAGGLKNLFSNLDIERLEVPTSGGPIFALTWMLKLWRQALPAAVAADFDALRVADLAVDPMSLVDMPFVRQLPEATNVQLASLNVLVGRKPQ